MRKAQTGSEYLVLVGGVIFIGILMFLLLRGQLLPQAGNRLQQGSSKYLDEFGKPYLCYDSFDASGDESRWKTNGGLWRIANGVYQQEAVDPGRSLSTFCDSTLGNYSIQADVKHGVGIPGSSAGLLARANTAGGYVCEASFNKFLYLRNCPTWTTCALLASGSLGASFDAAKGYTIKFTLKGPSLTCSIGGSSISATNQIRTVGEVGLTTDSASASFDNVKVASS